MPSLEQIQNYIRNRRYRIGELNDIDELKEFIQSLKYDDDLADDDIFVFGEDIGIFVTWNLFAIYHII